MKIQIINGPNLNLLGKREKNLYGSANFEDYMGTLKELFKDIQIDYFQSNVEGELINKLHETGFEYNGIILNAGGYTHTSVSIADAIAAIETQVVEVHITNILSREVERHTSLIAKNCLGAIIGFGFDSYRLAIESLRALK